MITIDILSFALGILFGLIITLAVLGLVFVIHGDQ